MQAKRFPRVRFFSACDAQRNQRAERKGLALFFRQADQRRVMTMGKPGQARLQRHGNIGGAEIEHDETEAAGAQKFLAGAREYFQHWANESTTSAAKSMPF